MPTTPEELETLRRIHQSVLFGGDMGATVIAEIRAAVEAEREACAQTADEARRAGNPEGAAEAIRARGSK